MDIAIIRGTNDKPGASKLLEDAVRQWAQSVGNSSAVSGRLYIGYPVIATPDGPRRIDALLASEALGFVAFDLVEGDAIAGHEQRQDDFANAIEARLRTQRALVERANGQRRLLVPVNAVSFAPYVHEPSQDDDYPVANASTLATHLDGLGEAVSDSRAFKIALSALEAMLTIRRPVRGRPSSALQSRGAALRRLERAVATLDVDQACAAIETADGVQRIRGLAGSGKTIVLAQKAAYLHARHPDWRIAVAFHTRSTKGHLRDLVTRFYANQTMELPNWERLRIDHAWGGPEFRTDSGIYRDFCMTNGATHLDFEEAKSLVGPSNAFQEACRRALDEVEEPEAAFDAVLVDEAHDLPTEFLVLCYRSLTKDKRLIYAYDELQNLAHDSVQAPRDIFGPDVRWREDEPGSDIVLRRCYRNSRPVLTTAHALGFGIHRKLGDKETTGIVQMFDDVQMWRDVGYQAFTEDIQHGAPVAFRRTGDTSPKFLEEPASVDDLVVFRAFADSREQAEWVAKQICKNLNDGLLPEDVIVINPDSSSILESTAPMRAQLLGRGVQSHLAGAVMRVEEFYRDGSVTFTGIHGAKGHEAGMVYVVNAHDCAAHAHDLARWRNRLFTAITRSKAWVRVCGIRDGIEQLAAEHASLEKDDYELRFRYPTMEQLEAMRALHRDIPKIDPTLCETHNANLRRLLADLEERHVRPEDIVDLQPVLRHLNAVKEADRLHWWS